jgi:hypothetical protein
MPFEQDLSNAKVVARAEGVKSAIEVEKKKGSAARAKSKDLASSIPLLLSIQN